MFKIYAAVLHFYRVYLSYDCLCAQDQYTYPFDSAFQNKVYDKPLFSAARSQANQTVEWFVQKLNDPNNQFSVSQAELVRVPSTMPLYKIGSTQTVSAVACLYSRP